LTGPPPTRTTGLDPHPLLAAVFRALDDEGVGWCVLRGVDELHAPAGDVDLLIARADAARLAGVVGRLGFVRMAAWGYGSHMFYLAYDAATDVWLKLDVVTELAFGPGFSLRTDAAAECLRRRRRRDGIAVLADGDAFWCLLLHQILDDGRIPPSVAEELHRLAAAPDCGASPLARDVERIAPPALGAERLLDAARRADAAALEVARSVLIAAWTRSQPGSVWRRRAISRLGRRASPIVRSRRGLTVALLGPDGAGKSTAAEALERTFYFPVRVVYMSPGRPSPGRTLPGVGLALRIGGQLARRLGSLRHRARGRLVVFDRYAYDALLAPRRPLGRLGRLRRWLLGHACPPPMLTVVLDAPGTLLHARKHEQDPATLEAERQGYLALVARRRRAAVLDATRDADAVRRDLTAAIWEVYRSRWNTPRRLAPRALRTAVRR
jgi:thymidylate kinase